MTQSAIETLTRRAALTTLGAGGLMSFTGSLAANGKNKRKRKGKKTRKPCKDACQPQAGQCRAVFEETLCPVNPDGCAAALACCSSLETCDSLEFLVCIFTPPSQA